MEKRDKKNIVKRRLKKAINISLVAALLTMLSYVLMVMRVPHVHVIFLFMSGFSVLLFIYLALWVLSANKKYSKLAKRLFCLYFIILVVGVVAFSILQVLIISGIRSDEADADVVIVLGAGLVNGRPGLMLASRLEAAIEYVQYRNDVPIIVTGGLGQGETVTEAEAMSRYLIARGVDESQIWKEEASTNTRENLAFAKEIIEERGLDPESITVAVVSNEFHLYRARLIAERAGLNPIGIAAATPGLHRQLLYFFREAFSLTRELLF